MSVLSLSSSIDFDAVAEVISNKFTESIKATTKSIDTSALTSFKKFCYDFLFVQLALFQVIFPRDSCDVLEFKLL